MAAQAQDPRRGKNKNDANHETYVPQSENWDPEIDKIETVHRDEEGILQFLLRFNNGRKKELSNSQARMRCPQALLDFYEANLLVQCPVKS
jgi:hypothetical protein